MGGAGARPAAGGSASSFGMGHLNDAQPTSFHVQTVGHAYGQALTAARVAKNLKLVDAAKAMGVNAKVRATQFADKTAALFALMIIITMLCVETWAFVLCFLLHVYSHLSFTFAPSASIPFVCLALSPPPPGLRRVRARHCEAQRGDDAEVHQVLRLQAPRTAQGQEQLRRVSESRKHLSRPEYLEHVHVSTHVSTRVLSVTCARGATTSKCFTCKSVLRCSEFGGSTRNALIVTSSQ